jgi:hypothetical protein
LSGETGKVPSGWTLDTLHVHVNERLGDLRVQLDERYATQTRALDAAFASQQTALSTALAAVDQHHSEQIANIWREFAAHLEQVREETRVAFIASEKAIAKAEQSMEKRLDGMNEFRETLRDQAATFLSRAEAGQRMDSLSESLGSASERNASRISAIELRMQTVPTHAERDTLHQASLDREAAMSKRIDRLTLDATHEAQRVSTRLDTRDGRGAGLNAAWIYAVGLVAAIGTFISIVNTIKP